MLTLGLLVLGLWQWVVVGGKDGAVVGGKDGAVVGGKDSDVVVGKDGAVVSGKEGAVVDDEIKEGGEGVGCTELVLGDETRGKVNGSRLKFSKAPPRNFAPFFATRDILLLSMSGETSAVSFLHNNSQFAAVIDGIFAVSLHSWITVSLVTSAKGPYISINLARSI